MLVPVPGSALRGARLLCRSRPESAFGAPPACPRRKKLCCAVQCRFSRPLHAPRGAAHHSRRRLFRHAECPQRAEPPPAADAALRIPSNATHGAAHPLQSKPVHVVKPSAPRGNSDLRRNGATASFRAHARRIHIAPNVAFPRRQTLREARGSRLQSDPPTPRRSFCRISTYIYAPARGRIRLCFT